MATLNSLRNDLRTWTATHANPAVLPDAICDECINAAMRLMEEAHLWRGAETTSVALSYAANTESMSLPVDFVAQKAIYQQTDTGSIPLLAYMEKTLRDEWIRVAEALDRLLDPAP